MGFKLCMWYISRISLETYSSKENMLKSRPKDKGLLLDSNIVKKLIFNTSPPFCYVANEFIPIL